MEKLPGVEVLRMETSEGGLKEVVLRWFTDTQASLILHNGTFPAWFQGFISRKDSEELLRDKNLGCFLIRLSDKAIGYILSYRGKDRCRHFVVSQNSAGLFIIAGDCQIHHSLSEMIEHYKANPIEPFGEHLTSCVSENITGEVYDVVSVQDQDSGVSVQALRSLWDKKVDCKTGQMSDVSSKRVQQKNVQQSIPVLPPKLNNRKLTGTVSVDATSLSQAAPPLPKRGMTLSHSLTGSLADIPSHYGDVQHTPVYQHRAESLRWSTNPERADDQISERRGEGCMTCMDAVTQYHKEPTGHSTGVMYSIIGDVKGSASTKYPDMEEHSNRLSTASITTSILPTLVTCHTYTLPNTSRGGKMNCTKTDNLSDRLDFLTFNPLYQASNGPEKSTQNQGDNMYAEVPHGQRHSDATYELIPELSSAAQSNTYESLEDVKPKQSKSISKNNINWRKFLS